jgi:hypothetical protein
MELQQWLEEKFPVSHGREGAGERPGNFASPAGNFCGRRISKLHAEFFTRSTNAPGIAA